MKGITRALSVILLTAVVTALPAYAVLDYTDMANWTYHPDKAGSGIRLFNPEISVINKDGGTDTVMSIANNALVNTGVDVFYVHPTQVTNSNELVPRNVPLDEQPYELMIIGTTLAQVGPLVKYGRLFAPRYREANPVTYFSVPGSTQAVVQAETHADIAAAFDHYLANYNNGNKIILAGHSQGSFVLAMLLRSRFDNNPALQSKLVAAVLGGVAAAYAPAGQKTGGWWETIAPCTTRAQCGCVMSWRSFLEGSMISGGINGRPCDNPLLKDAGLVYKNYADSDVHYHDSLYYGTDVQPLRNYLELTTRAGAFNAYDSMYTARYLRDGSGLGLMLQYDPEPGDTRPDPLAGDTLVMGAHNHDYAIYLWALMAQLDEKLDAMAGIRGVAAPVRQSGSNAYGTTVFDVHGRRWPVDAVVPPGVYLVPGRDGLRKMLIQ